MQRLWYHHVIPIRISVRWAMLLGWLFIIFMFSQQPDYGHTAASWGEFIARKLAHIIEYAILAILIYGVFTATGSVTKKHLAWVLVFSIVFATIDEYHQTFVPGRSGVMTDVLVDTIGAIMGLKIIRSWETSL